MAPLDDKIRHSRRRKNHIAKDLRSPKYRERTVDPKRLEDEAEKRFRRYHTFDEYFDTEWHPYDQNE